MFARLNVKFEPLEDPSAPIVVLDRCFGEGALPDTLKTAALEELRSRGQGGGIIGSFPLTGIRISLLGGETREVGSDEVAFRIAANDAFDLGLEQGGPTLLEPVMKLDITTPDDYVGEIVATCSNAAL